MVKKFFFYATFFILIGSLELWGVTERRKSQPNKTGIQRRRNAYIPKSREKITSKKEIKKTKKNTSCSCSECTSMCMCGTLGFAWGMCMMSDTEIIENNAQDYKAELKTYAFPVLVSAIGTGVGKAVHLLLNPKKKKD